jgi:hypothetical protein
MGLSIGQMTWFLQQINGLTGKKQGTLLQIKKDL